MKNLILKLMGLNAETVSNLRNEVNDLIKTVDSLKDEAKSYYKKTEEFIILYKNLDIDRTQEKWWDNDNVSHFDNFETMILADKIKKNDMKEWIIKHPSLKERLIFHGGCLGCQTPILEGCKICLKCKYSNFGSDNKDLSNYKK